MRTLRHRPWGLLLPLVVGLALRLLMASAIHAPWGDNGATVLELARNITEGKGFTTLRVWTFHGSVKQFGQPEGNRQPLLPILEAAARRVGGPSFRVAQLVPLVAGTAVIPLSYAIGATVGGSIAGSLAAWFAALDPPQIYFSAQIEDQILFTALFLGLVLWSLRSGTTHTPRPWVPGVLLGLLYLTRTNALLVAAAYMTVCLWRRRIRHAAAVALIAAAVASPWLIRTARVFGNPLHTDNSFFLWSDDFPSVFSLRDGPPSLHEYLASHTLPQMAIRWLKGAYLCLEGIAVGNIFRGEPFARDSLILPLAAALVGLWRHRRPLAFVGASFVLHFVTVAWHAHGTYRYFLPFYAVVFAGAGAGLTHVWSRWVTPRSPRERIWAGTAAAFVFLFPLIRPMGQTLSSGDQATHREATEVVHWIERSTPPDAVIMAFPIVEKYIAVYARPTVMTPYGELEDVWRVVCDYGVDYLVVSGEQLRWRPALRRLWIADNDTIVERASIPFMRCELTSKNGMFRVYRIDREALCTP